MLDTIKAETTLIEEDALTAESLRFESEPWTRFYLAGEIIRELQKTSGKQSKYAIEGNATRSDEVIDHARATSAASRRMTQMGASA